MMKALKSYAIFFLLSLLILFLSSCGTNGNTAAVTTGAGSSEKSRQTDISNYSSSTLTAVSSTQTSNTSTAVSSTQTSNTSAATTSTQTSNTSAATTSTQTIPIVPPALELIEAYPALSFNQPLDYQHPDDKSNRIFVAEKSGKIFVFDNNPQVTAATLFIDLKSRIDSSSSEKGLLGLAFHPNYRENGFFYVNYTNRTSTVIARYQASPNDSDKGLIDSEKILLTFTQPYSNHNGGQLAFGPDGYLYISTGDGGSAGDPQRNAQNRASLLGKLLRIDIDNPDAGKPYGIPDDNPFAGNNQGYREEIFAYGLRNSWRFSFDPKRNLLWAGDVGQNRIEEIDIIKNGMNYGWNIMEGSSCYPVSADCKRAGLELPVWEYTHSEGYSVTGGFVYYGSKIPGLTGAYIYGDYGSGTIWALWIDENIAPVNHVLLNTSLNISSFGLDEDNELYIVDYRGKIYTLAEKL